MTNPNARCSATAYRDVHVFLCARLLVCLANLPYVFTREISERGARAQRESALHAYGYITSAALVGMQMTLGHDLIENVIIRPLVSTEARLKSHRL